MKRQTKLPTSLRAKIFGQLSKMNATATDQISSIPSLKESQKQPSGSDSDADSVGSLADHLVRMEDIDLDSNFYSQPYPDTKDFSTSETGTKVELSDADSDWEAEKTLRVSTMLSQLNDYEQKFNPVMSVCNNTQNKVNEKTTLEQPDNIVQVICKTEYVHNKEHTTEQGSGDEWEPIHNFENRLSTDSIEVVVREQPKRFSKVVDVDAQLNRLLQDERREKQLLLHKVHLLCLLSYGYYLNRLVNQLIIENADEILCALRGISTEVPEQLDFIFLQTVCDTYRKNNRLKKLPQIISFARKNTSNRTSTDVSSKEAYVVLFAAVLRFLCVETRLVMHLNVLSKSIATKSKRLAKLSANQDTNETDVSLERYPNVPLTTAEILKRKPEFSHFSQIPQVDGADDQVVEEKRPRFHVELDTKPKLWKLKKINNSVARNKAGNRKELIPKKKSVLTPVGKSNIKVETDSVTRSPFFEGRKVIGQNNFNNQLPKENVPSIWVEVFLPSEKRWLVVDIQPGKYDCLDHVVEKLSSPPAYVFGWTNDNTLHDVTARYWWNNETGAKRQRVAEKWLQSLLHHFGRRRKTLMDLLDVQEFRRLRFRAPIPKKLSDFKNHPSYCLKRDLLKFQAIYPPEAPPLGFLGDEPIYARKCVHTLHSREVWLRHAKVIRLYEQPYKIVMSKLKREKTELELFGYWQTEEYVPPEPVGGRVPRNAYGNIEIFKDCMLPKGTVHLKQINISKICRKMNVDYAIAVVGFGIHAGGNHPVFDGIVICKEFEQQVLEEYERDKVEQELRKHLRREKAIYDRWRRLIKGLIIRNRLKYRYNFDL
ncbi:DNA repair protein complementing XP-C cells homolog [Malaya genurostris]|uniref:DNA repair protein complementing XP-C cells homolog n=1 Tax=Malaya genurostris TaxID=325434 RepID=UPI0026F3A99A|nr:DNA repair protein complementing XP-C cells homolog [Malaya genurostris]